MKNSNLKIFMGIHEICGHYKNLETGLRKAGNLADFISLEIDNIH